MRITYRKTAEFVLWNFDQENIMPPEELIAFYQEIIQDAPLLIKLFNEEITFPNPSSGFMWNDISINQDNAFECNPRGTCL